jgi:hypothetical protein
MSEQQKDQSAPDEILTEEEAEIGEPRGPEKLLSDPRRKRQFERAEDEEEEKKTQSAGEGQSVECHKSPPIVHSSSLHQFLRFSPRHL